MASPTQHQGWDPEVLARIRTLQLHARTLVDGYLHGAHMSGRSTSAVEFADYKEYSPGDPLRDLDWRVMGRTDRLVVRRHKAETDLATTLVVDASGDMNTGASGDFAPRGSSPFKGTKWGYAAVLAATLAYWLNRSGEPVGLHVLGGKNVRWRWLPPRTGEAQLVRILGVLSGLRPSGRADLAGGLTTLGSRLRRRQMVVLISDLMEEPDEWGDAVSALLQRRADLRVVHLHDRHEWAMDLPDAGLFRSPEGGEQMAEDPDEIRQAFREEVQTYLTQVRAALGRVRGVHLLAPTDQPMELLLSRLLRGV